MPLKMASMASVRKRQSYFNDYISLLVMKHMKHRKQVSSNLVLFVPQVEVHRMFKRNVCRFFFEFGFYVIFCAVSLLCLYNTLIITNFNILKYIKRIFKILIQYTFNTQKKQHKKTSKET